MNHHLAQKHITMGCRCHVTCNAMHTEIAGDLVILKTYEMCAWDIDMEWRYHKQNVCKILPEI